MKLYFKDSHGEMRVIAEFDNGKTDKEYLEAAEKEIKRFCDERNFKIYYTRVWHEDRSGQKMTKFDVGSHTEFFYLDQAINLKACIDDGAGCIEER